VAATTHFVAPPLASAGKGIIHSEMPRVTDRVLHGFQLWINLPAELKMCKPQYQVRLLPPRAGPTSFSTTSAPRMAGRNVQLGVELGVADGCNQGPSLQDLNLHI